MKVFIPFDTRIKHGYSFRMKRIVCFTFFCLAGLLLTSCSAVPKEAGQTLPDPPITTEDRIRTQIALIEQTAATPTGTGTATQTASPTISPTITLTATPSLIPRTPTATLSTDYFHGSYSYDLPFLSQAGLKYKGAETELGCTAASIQVVLDFWHDYNETYSTMSAQRIIDINTSQGTFHAGSGLSITNVEDELNSLDYYLGIRRNSGKQDLIDALERYGPLPVLVKTEWIPSKANHLAVLTEYDPETDSVTLNDPWYEWPITWNWEAFDGIWSLNYSENEDGYLVRTFFFIVPNAELRPGQDLFIPETAGAGIQNIDTSSE